MRTFHTDGTTTDQEGNSPPWQARWDWVSAASVPSGVPSAFTGPVLRLTTVDAPTPPRYQDLYFYSVTFDSPDTLVLVFFNGLGRVLEYTRAAD